MNLCMRFLVLILGILGFVFAAVPTTIGGEASPSWKVEWEKVVGEAKKEGKLVAGIPASAELRNLIDERFRARFPGIELELLPGRGPVNANRILSEHKAGVRNFDLLLSGTSTPFGLLDAGLIEPVEAFFLLPEVRDGKNWYGGHIWIDNAKRFIYSFQAYQSESVWHNASVIKVEEFRSYEDLLNPKWKGKVGYLDPRTPGSGTATWAFLWKQKGEEFLRKLAQQELFLSRDQRQLADALAKGSLAVTVGIHYYTFLPHVKAGLPVKPVPDLREGEYTTNGSGALSLIKNPPHPNATRLFINWLLSKEGQELYGQAMGQATRRLDVDTKWLRPAGVKAAKDYLSVEEHYRLENYSEETVKQIWSRSVKLAEEILK